PNYMGDELLALGRYDFEYRIPHVPAGAYEIRFGYSVSSERAITQFYYDDKVCGIPVDMTLGSTNPLIGWFPEEGLNDEQIKENDKAMRNRGYMKGPASCALSKDGESMRKSELALRKIIGTFNITKGDHWLRFKNVTENEKSAQGNWVQFNQDYLEIVPTSIISNPAKPEDQN
ncbi:MAG: fasciclin domain-containing protein, partial [Bacteroidaceae bacterium]|nr:fasciclin domain-containing protein [Bacteroidaceae bacterium]